jgi:hypothetical protein
MANNKVTKNEQLQEASEKVSNAQSLLQVTLLLEIFKTKIYFISLRVRLHRVNLQKQNLHCP